MRIQLYSGTKRVVLATAVVTTLFLLIFVLEACQQSQPPVSAPPGEPKPATAKVYVEFRGPWAFVPDPKDANTLLAVAPKAKGHRDLYVQASNESTLAAGVYDLSVPARSGSGGATPDSSIAQAKIDAQGLQRALDSKSARYVIRLPRPEAYAVAGRARSRFGTSYPPDGSTEKDYASAVALRYDVSSLNGFSLAGSPDNGAFKPLLLQVETPTVRFIIEPAQEDDPHDKCDTHSRESFHDLTALLGLTLYVDFPADPDECHKKDPQNAHPAKAEGSWGSIEQVAAIDIRRVAQRLVTAFYLFAHPAGDCKAPILVLSLS